MGYSPCYSIWVGWTLTDIITYINQNNIEDFSDKLNELVNLGEEEDLGCCFERVYWGDRLVGYGITVYHISRYDGITNFSLQDVTQQVIAGIEDLENLIKKYNLPDIKINQYNFADLT